MRYKEDCQKMIDLTHIIREDVPVYPDTETPKLLPDSTCEWEGFGEREVIT